MFFFPWGPRSRTSNLVVNNLVNGEGTSTAQSIATHSAAVTNYTSNSWSFKGNEVRGSSQEMPRDFEENDEDEGLIMGNLVVVAYGIHEGLAGHLNGGDESEGGDLEPPYVLEPDLGYLIMSSGQSQHTASQPSSSVPLPSHNLTSDSHTSRPSEASPMITKLTIEFNGDGVNVGPNHAKWNTQVRVYVRARIPIHYKDWRKIDGSFKDNVWNKLMDKEDPSRKHGRVDSWKKGHERRDGTILAALKPIMQVLITLKLELTYVLEQVEASNKRRKEASAGGESSVMEVDFDNNELSEVFGPDKKSRTRGINSRKSKKKLQRTGIVKALLQQASFSSNSELKGEMNEMKTSLSNVMGVLKRALGNFVARLVLFLVHHPGCACVLNFGVMIDTSMLASELNRLGALNHFTVIRKLEGGIFPMGFMKEVTDRNSKAGLNILGVESSGRALLNRPILELHKLDNDVLVGHNISGFDLAILLHRA
ncbi:hypothetical protein IFM89_017941 [Coptis chinensis]|uniref:DNA-directed DNA polymerase n=1 Tax=Coptis chinensis TaxID=261450 RepID=A0A835HWF2_9MAGN|nr:hypothetical protein IFM89_017941 [Coptis chinensis]